MRNRLISLQISPASETSVKFKKLLLGLSAAPFQTNTSQLFNKQLA